MERLARELAISGRPVVDRTGLDGAYDFELRFASPTDPQSTAPSLFSALSEQLGLRLEPSTAPVRVLVIDDAERPDAT